FTSAGRLDVIVEAFNLFDTTNYNVNSVSASEFLGAATVPNANFGKYLAAFPGREIQLGLRYAF
ncbi:MAG TPA: hypothetical protein VGF40_07125, partial [Thermoanaerobaculia bacterium]